MRRDIGVVLLLVLIFAITTAGCGVSIKPAPAKGSISGTAGSTSSAHVATPSLMASPDPVATRVVDSSPKAATPAAKASSTAKPKPTSTPTPTVASRQTAAATHPAGQPPATSNVAPAPDPEQTNTNSPAERSTSPAGAQSVSKPAPTPTSAIQPAAPTTQPASTPTPTAPGLPSCQTEPVRGFGLAWHDYPTLANAIGCPLGPEIGLPAKVQAYQHGLMIWLDLQAYDSNIDSQSWVVALGGTTANRTRFDDSGLTWEPGQVAPSGAFAWVYQNVYTDANRLGSPSSALGQSDAAIELFEHGTMIWLRNPPGSSTSEPMIYVIESNLVTDATGSFQAVPDKSFQ